jgi:hypothetical protein
LTPEFSLGAKSENNSGSAGGRISERGKKHSPDWQMAHAVLSLLANPHFHSHLASWRVVIRTPDYTCLSFLFFSWMTFTGT